MALSVNVSEALRLPKADGVNSTFTTQVPVGTTVAPVQVSATFGKITGISAGDSYRGNR